MNKIRRLAAALALAWPALSVQASGGEAAPTAVSVPKVQPEPAALAGYLHGHLGVLWPSYDRTFLMMAYRQTMGHAAMTPAETASWLQPDTSVSPGADWLAARSETGAAAPAAAPDGGQRAVGAFNYAGNCQPDAFHLAAATLRARRQAHAAQSAALKDWIAGQDAVFAACDKPDAAAPHDVPAGAPAWLRQDRAYQQAASLFYRNQGDEAAKAFEAIAADAASPWHEWASYLLARLWWRETFEQPADYRQFASQSANWRAAPMPARLSALAAGAHDGPVREAAAGLLRTLQSRIDPIGLRRELWQRIDAAQPPADLADWVADERFSWALLKDEDVQDDWLYLTRSVGRSDAPGRRAADPAATWTPHPAPAWLATTLMAARPDTPGLDAVVAASRKLSADDPIYLHCAWQRARLALERHDFADARRELAAVRPRLAGEAMGTRQAFDQLEMLVAPSLQALAGHVARLPLALESVDDDIQAINEPVAQPAKPFIDDETLAWLAAHLDNDELLAIARDARLPQPLRVQLASGAWLRAALLAQAELEAAALQLLGSLDAYRDAAGAATLPERRFRMARHLLMNELSSAGFDSRRTDTQLAPAWQGPPAFHDEAATARLAQVLDGIHKSNNTTWMGQAMLPWLGAHRSAEGPALLERLVYASRYGQGDTATSRAAFLLLHKQYPNSPEAQRTRYYF